MQNVIGNANTGQIRPGLPHGCLMTTDGAVSRDWLTANEAAAFLGVTKAAVTKAARLGRFPRAYKASEVWHLDRSDVEKYAAERRSRGA